MATKLDQIVLIRGYLRKQYHYIPSDLIYLIAMFYNVSFPCYFTTIPIKKTNTNYIQYNNDYKFECVTNNKGNITLAMTSTPKRISHIVIYYELSCHTPYTRTSQVTKEISHEEIDFNWNDIVTLRKWQRTILCGDDYIVPSDKFHIQIGDESRECTFHLYITILREQYSSFYREKKKAKIVRNVTMNYCDDFEWIIHTKHTEKFVEYPFQEFNRHHQICSSTFGRSHNLFLSLERSANFWMCLRLHVLLIPTEGDNINCVRTVTMNCDVHINGLDENFNNTVCNTFGCGDSIQLWHKKNMQAYNSFFNRRHQGSCWTGFPLHITVHLELFKVYARNGSEVSGDEWEKYGIIY
eukprot:320139_1